MNRSFVRRIIFNLLFLITPCLILAAPLASASTVESSLTTKKAPDFTLPTIDGKTVTLSELRGQVVYVDFWATWCPPCRKSFPWMQKMHDRYAKTGLKIIAISLDGKRELIDDFLKSNPVSFTIAHDPKGESADAYKLIGMPSSYIIDRHGNIQQSHAGFRNDDKDKLEAQIKAVLFQ